MGRGVFVSTRTREHTHCVQKTMNSHCSEFGITSWYPSRKHGFRVEDFVDLKGLKHIDPREEPAQAQMMKS